MAYHKTLWNVWWQGDQFLGQVEAYTEEDAIAMFVTPRCAAMCTACKIK